MENIHTCIRCGDEFKEWEYDEDCCSCEDGAYESERDYATVIVTCPICKGSGFLRRTITKLCQPCLELAMSELDEY